METVRFKGCDYQIDADGAVYVIKTKRLGQIILGTYRQRITSAPKIRKLRKLAELYALPAA